MSKKEKQIRAVFDDQTITVYQAYSNAIAITAVKNQKFISPFKMNRMTWIKPSFLWMMYRSGWAQKIGQENVLAIKIKRDGFQWALDQACLSKFDPKFYNSKEEWKQELRHSSVRLQWDPERGILMEKLNYKSIQIGLTQDALYKYVNQWIVSIKNITPLCQKIHSLTSKDIGKAKKLIPKEKIYPLT